MAAPARKADPWHDTDVIDKRAPRFNQAIVGLVALAGAVFGWPLAWALMGAQLLIGLTLGRRFCLTGLAYFGLIQPRIGEGELEDARAPRLANMMGAAFLGGAAIAWWPGAPAVGTALGAIVAALALIDEVTALCVGCELYRRGARLRGISPQHHSRIDPSVLDGHAAAPRVFVEFTHPLCGECLEWERRLSGESAPLVKLDVRERPELAHKYGVAIVPTVVEVSSDGTVLARLAP